MNGYRLGIILSIVIALLICGALAACGAAEQHNAGTDNTSSAVTEPANEPESEAAEPTTVEPAVTEPAVTESQNAESESTEALQTEQAEAEKPPEAGEPENEPHADRQAIVDEAAAQLGVPYESGGSSPEEGFDSSGFVYYCVRAAGIDFPRQIRSQLESGEKIAYSDLQPGDAVYFSQEPGGEASFCGIYAGGGLLIYSPVPDDYVKTANITTGYWTSRFVTGIRPL